MTSDAVRPAEIVHQCPPDRGARYPCCGRFPLYSLGDRMTLEPALVTCPGRGAARVAGRCGPLAGQLATQPCACGHLVMVHGADGCPLCQLSKYLVLGPDDVLVVSMPTDMSDIAQDENEQRLQQIHKDTGRRIVCVYGAEQLAVLKAEPR